MGVVEFFLCYSSYVSTSKALEVEAGTTNFVQGIYAYWGIRDQQCSVAFYLGLMLAKDFPVFSIYLEGGNLLLVKLLNDKSAQIP